MKILYSIRSINICYLQDGAVVVVKVWDGHFREEHLPGGLQVHTHNFQYCITISLCQRETIILSAGF